MNNKNNNLSPEHSPKSLTTAGVKKVNNIPLIIVVSVVMMFSMLIAMVAAKKASAQRNLAPKIKIQAKPNDTYRFARDVIANGESHQKKNPLAKPVSTATMLKVESMPTSTEKAYPPETAVNEVELERIRQEKSQQFEEAVKSKILVTVNTDVAHPQKEVYQTHPAQRAPLPETMSFKEQLKMLQNNHVEQQTAASIGGKENEARWQLHSNLQNPSTPYELRAGSVIPGILISGIRSELHGQIIAQVSQDVYDTATGNHLLIPQGTKLLGVYSNNVKFGQSSVLVAWQRLSFPDGKALDIGAMPGSDSAGFAGFRDEVDHHYARIYGSALLMSGIVAGVSYSQSRNQGGQGNFRTPSVADVLSQSLGQQLSETTSQLIAKNINTAPTFNINPGYEFNVMVTKDLAFRTPYQQFSY